MKYNAEQITFMLHEAIDQDREYKSWHVSTKHLMTLVEMVVAEERKPLTDEEILTYKHMIDWTAEWSYINFARAIEAAHNIKGGA
jgi:hypothetical protein